MVAALFRSKAIPAADSLAVPSLGGDAPDRKLLTTAAAVAVAVHVLAVMIPLPSLHVSPPPPIDIPDVPEIKPYHFDPPPPSQPLDLTVDRVPSRRLFAVPDAPPNEPLHEPVQLEIAIDSPVVPRVATVTGVVAPPVEPPSVYPEWTYGLTLPVGSPDRVKPEYPPIGLAIGQEGTVVLRAVITREGRVESIRVLQAPTPDPGFTDRAIEAVSQWTYRPGSLRGKPVAVELTVRVEFSLQR